MRLIQIADELSSRSFRVQSQRRQQNPRTLLMRALDLLGADLGLECSGEVVGEDVSGFDLLRHVGDVCPIHEWLVLEDHEDTLALELSGERPSAYREANN
jgi:hypothetical protein